MSPPLTDPAVAALLAYDEAVGDDRSPRLQLRLNAMRAALDAASAVYLLEAIKEQEGCTTTT